MARNGMTLIPRPPRLQVLLSGTERLDVLSLKSQELFYLANVLVAGSEHQGRSFTPREAYEASVAVCSLGLECWPDAWGAADEHLLASHDLATVFRVGWAVLHERVAMRSARRLLLALELLLAGLDLAGAGAGAEPLHELDRKSVV